MQKVTVFTDGGARGNPGPAAAGAVIYAGNERLICGKYLGNNTNNFAEYSAVILALDKLLQLPGLDAKETAVEVFADSLLVVKQLNGDYRVKSPSIKSLWQTVKSQEVGFARIIYQHVPREKNREADAEVNRILDETTLNSWHNKSNLDLFWSYIKPL